jgi:post-segregation antitoxin (ccd killing protein)
MNIINFHEQVADDLIERNKRLGISVSVLLSVGAEDETRGIRIS